MNSFIKIGKRSDFLENKPVSIQVKEQDMCVIQKDGRFYALHNECTHAHALLSDGEVEETFLTCPLHGARFSLETGDALTLPAVKPVKTYEVKVEGDDVFLKVDSVS